MCLSNPVYTSCPSLTLECRSHKACPYVTSSDQFFGTNSTARLHHSNGFLSFIRTKLRETCKQFLPENYYFAIYKTYIVYSLKDYGSGEFAANLAVLSVLACVLVHPSRSSVLSTAHLNVSKATIITAEHLVTSVTSEKERKNTAEKSYG